MSECTEKMCDNYCDGLCEVGCTPDVPDVVLKLQATLKEMEAENKRLSDAFEKVAEIALRNNPTGGGDWLLEAILLSRHEPMPPHLVGALRERLGEPTDIELEERRRLRNKPTEQSNNKS